MSVATPVRQHQPVVVAATVLCATSMLGLGLWAFLDPPSFSGFVDYAIDRHLGGHDSDVPSLGLPTVVALVAICVRIRGRST